MGPEETPFVVWITRKTSADFGVVREAIERLDILEKAAVRVGSPIGFKAKDLAKRKFVCRLDGIDVEFDWIATSIETENEFVTKYNTHAQWHGLEVRTIVEFRVTRVADGPLIFQGKTEVEAGALVRKMMGVLRGKIERVAHGTSDYMIRAFEEICNNPQEYQNDLKSARALAGRIAGPITARRDKITITIKPLGSDLHKLNMIFDSDGAPAPMDRSMELEPKTWEGLSSELEDLQLFSALPLDRNRSTSLTKTDANERISKLRQIGKDMYMLALPQDVKKEINARSGSLRLALSKELLHVPWELFHDDSDFLCLRYALGRNILADRHVTVAPRTRGDKVRFLLVGDPTSDLPEALTEVDLIEKTLLEKARSKWELEIVTYRQSDAKKLKFLNELATGRHDVVHFAGHAQFDPERPEHSSLRFADGIPCLPGEINEAMADKPPAVFFANACSSARSTEGTASSRNLGAGLATTLIEGGVLCYIGSGWPVHDTWAGRLASSFYEGILKGSTFGEAMKEAREKTMDESKKMGNLTWSAFVMYGSPEATFQRAD